MNMTTKTAPAASAEEDATLSLRIHAKLVERADGLIEFLSEQSGRVCTRSDVWREALVRGLRAIEKARENGT